MTADAEPIPLLLTLGFPGDGTFNLRFPPEYRDEIESLLDENGIEHETIMELSAGTDLAIEAVKVVFGAGGVTGGLIALTSFYKTFVHRHDGKRIVLKRGDFELTAAGFSDKKTSEFLQTAVKEQDKRDADWDRASGKKPEDESDQLT